MIDDWILRENLKPFCRFCAYLAQYSFDTWDWDAIELGAKKSSSSPKHQFEYVFHGDRALSVQFSLEPEGGFTGLVFINLSTDEVFEYQLHAAIALMQKYILTER